MRWYSERLTAPLFWWVSLATLLATLWVAYLVVVGPFWATLVTGVVAAAGFGVLAGYGRVRISVETAAGAAGDTTAPVLCAGGARLPLSAVGTVHVLTPAAARRLRGPDADPRAFLVLRAYLPGAVRVDVTDQADPTPYWYLSTRDPRGLATAVEQARNASAHPA